MAVVLVTEIRTCSVSGTKVLYGSRDLRPGDQLDVPIRKASFCEVCGKYGHDSTVTVVRRGKRCK